MAFRVMGSQVAESTELTPENRLPDVQLGNLAASKWYSASPQKQALLLWKSSALECLLLTLRATPALWSEQSFLVSQILPLPSTFSRHSGHHTAVLDKTDSEGSTFAEHVQPTLELEQGLPCTGESSQ